MIKVGIVGGTGYTGVELLRLLAQHPEVELTAITSRAEAGSAVADMFPSLRGRIDLKFSDPASAPLKDCQVVFFATPNGVAMQQARSLLDAGVRVIDLAGDYIVVVNVDKLRVTGNKAQDKKYFRHSGFPGGIYETNFIKLQQRFPARVLEKAVKGMLPKGPLGYAMLKKMKCYAGAEHPHAAQQPKTLEI